MALPKLSFTIITQEEFDARRKEEAVAATTAALPAQPPRQFSAPVVVVSKLKKKCSRPPFRSSKVIPVNSYMEVVGAIPLAPDLVVIVSYASSHMLKFCRSLMAKSLLTTLTHHARKLSQNLLSQPSAHPLAIQAGCCPWCKVSVTSSLKWCFFSMQLHNNNAIQTLLSSLSCPSFNF
jgi:hypothetical protein